MEIVGLDRNKIKKISKIKNEDNKTLDYRLKSYELFKKIDMPCFGPMLNPYMNSAYTIKINK